MCFSHASLLLNEDMSRACREFSPCLTEILVNAWNDFSNDDIQLHQTNSAWTRSEKLQVLRLICVPYILAQRYKVSESVLRYA